MELLPLELIPGILTRLSASWRALARSVCKAWAAATDARTLARTDILITISLAEWAHANGCPWESTACAFAAKSGHLAVLQWAHANGCPWNSWTCESAAEGGHLEVLQWARANGCAW